MLKSCGLFILLISLVPGSKAQYQVGIGTESIEPNNSIFSLALGGYGAPREGRFSVTWKKIAKYQPVKAITSLNGNFFAINANDELVTAGNTGDSWTIVNKSNKIAAITSCNNKLYAVNTNNELLEGNPAGNQVEWMKKGNTTYTIALACLNNTLYGIDDRMHLFTILNENTHPAVKIIGNAENAVSLAGFSDKIYALRSDGSIWFAQPGDKELLWTKAGRINGFTYNITLKHIGVIGNRVFGADAEGNMYTAEHNSRGDLISRAMAIRNNNKTAVIVSVDLVGIGYNIVNQAKDAIFQSRHIAPQDILVNISHTHFAPVSQSWPTWQPFNQQPDSIYLHTIVKRGIIRSIEKALDSMRPATLYFGRGSTNIGHNRSSDNLETPYDNDVDVIKVKYNNGDRPDVLVLTGCHPVFPTGNDLTYTISANYPGVTRRTLEQKNMAGKVMFIQGCAGDINPREASDIQTGMQLALDAMAVMQGNMRKLTGKISSFLDTVDIPVKPMSKEQVVEFKNNNLNKEGEVWAEKNVRWADLMLNKYGQGEITPIMPVYVQTVNIGSWKLVGLSREVVTDYSISIKKLWPSKQVSVAGYCNDVTSYLPVQSHITRHTYEGDDSFYWYGTIALFPTNVQDIILQQIKKKGR